MKKRKRNKGTPEERAAERARHDDLTRRLQAAIDHYRIRAREEGELREATGGAGDTQPVPTRKGWLEMSGEERAAERARSRDLDRRLLRAIDRYRKLDEQKRQTGEAGAS